jgi:hypothetical protein
MAEYIEREAVMQKFADHVRRSNNSDFAPVPTWNQAVQIVEDFPAADVRPVKWTLCKEKQPPQGRYLCVKQLFNGDFSYDVYSFTEDLSKVDKYDFPKNLYKGIGGWFDYDSEIGYFQTSVYAWMPLPPAPKEE